MKKCCNTRGKIVHDSILAPAPSRSPPESLHVLTARVGAEGSIQVGRLEGVRTAQRHASPALGAHCQQLRAHNRPSDRQTAQAA